MDRIVWQALFCLLAVSIAWSKGSEVATKEDNLPFWFKVYSKDGREGLTAFCKGKNPSIDWDSQTEVTCEFVNVRFNLPPKGPEIPLTLEEAALRIPEMAEEIRKEPQKAKEGWDKAVRSLAKTSCSSESKSSIQAKMSDPSIGPKRKRLLEGVVQACSSKDIGLILKAVNDFKMRTCSLYTDTFSLDFRKTGEGRWLYTQDRPDSNNNLKVYELIGKGAIWTLTETRVPMSKEKGEEVQKESQRTVWSWKHRDYEIPAQCDFISH